MLGQTTTSKEQPATRAQELHIRAKSQINKEMRKELLENGKRKSEMRYKILGELSIELLGDSKGMRAMIKQTIFLFSLSISSLSTVDKREDTDGLRNR